MCACVCVCVNRRPRVEERAGDEQSCEVEERIYVRARARVCVCTGTCVCVREDTHQTAGHDLSCLMGGKARHNCWTSHRDATASAGQCEQTRARARVTCAREWTNERGG